VIDQARGFAFINYQPRNSDLFYPLYFSLGLLMLGFIREYYTRQRRLRAGWQRFSAIFAFNLYEKVN
jgi:hypothetical protein